MVLTLFSSHLLVLLHQLYQLVGRSLHQLVSWILVSIRFVWDLRKPSTLRIIWPSNGRIWNDVNLYSPGLCPQKRPVLMGPDTYREVTLWKSLVRKSTCWISQIFVAWSKLGCFWKKLVGVHKKTHRLVLDPWDFLWDLWIQNPPLTSPQSLPDFHM